MSIQKKQIGFILAIILFHVFLKKMRDSTKSLHNQIIYNNLVRQMKMLTLATDLSVIQIGRAHV